MKTSEKRVKRALVKELGKINARLITTDADLRDTLGLDSLDLFLISLNLGVEFKKVCDSRTVQDLVDIVEQQK